MIVCDHCGVEASCDTFLGKMCETCYDEFESNYDDCMWLRYNADPMPFEMFMGRVELDEELDEDDDNIGGVG